MKNEVSGTLTCNLSDEATTMEVNAGRNGAEGSPDIRHAKEDDG
ncbi:MAG: hypothetical protein PVH68_13105 [Armatimonadota bacterium]|jgi:hypothetical protein